MIPTNSFLLVPPLYESAHLCLSRQRFVFLDFCRFRGLDDQAVFWHVIRRSTDPPVYPLGKCRHVQDGEQLKVPVPPVGKDVNIVPMPAGGDAGPLVTCVLDSCIFSSGMISRLYLPEYTYGAYVRAAALVLLLPPPPPLRHSLTSFFLSANRSLQTFYLKTWGIGMKLFVHYTRITSRATITKPNAWKNMVSGCCLNQMWVIKRHYLRSV